MQEIILRHIRPFETLPKTNGGIRVSLKPWQTSSCHRKGMLTTIPCFKCLEQGLCLGIFLLFSQTQRLPKRALVN